MTTSDNQPNKSSILRANNKLTPEEENNVILLIFLFACLLFIHFHWNRYLCRHFKPEYKQISDTFSYKCVTVSHTQKRYPGNNWG